MLYGLQVAFYGCNKDGPHELQLNETVGDLSGWAIRDERDHRLAQVQNRCGVELNVPIDETMTSHCVL